MSCSTAPSCSHWQRIPCSGSSKVVLQCLIRSREIPSMPGALPEAKLSITLLIASTDGPESNSSMVGRHAVDDVLLWVGPIQCLCNAIVHSPDVPCYGGCLLSCVKK